MVNANGVDVDDFFDVVPTMDIAYDTLSLFIIQFTPGGYVLFNPNGDADNDAIYVGTLRTIFRF